MRKKTTTSTENKTTNNHSQKSPKKLATKTAVDNPSPALQRAYADPPTLTATDAKILQRTIGNQALRRLSIQRKMTLGSVDDKYEQEADAVAKQVVGNLQAPQTLATTGETTQRPEKDEEEVQMKPLPNTSTLQRAEVEEDLQMKPLLQRQENEDEVQAKGDPMLAGGELSGDIEGTVQSAKSGGQPLNDTVRKPMEQAFNADFSSIKIHSGSQADILNRSLSARAFTSGQDIFFRENEYNPSSNSGQELLAHELTHVVQQNPGSIQKKTQPPSQQNDQVKKPQALITSPQTASISKLTSIQRIQRQRKMGFEMEDADWRTWKRTSGIRSPYWKKADDKRNVRPMNKREVLHQGSHFRMEADEFVEGGELLSDIEFVTDPLPLNLTGYDQLNKALTQISAIYEHITPLHGSNHKNGEFVKNDRHQLSVASSMLSKGADKPRLNLQATQGLGLEDIPVVFNALTQSPDEEDAEHPELYALVQRAMVGDKDASTMSALEPMKSASERAINIALAYLEAEFGDEEFELEDVEGEGIGDLRKLHGFLTAAIGFARMMRNPLVIQGGAKTYTPLMHRNDFSTMFKLLPKGLRTLILTHRPTFIDAIIAGVVGDPDSEDPLKNYDAKGNRQTNLFEKFIIENPDRDRFFEVSGGKGGLPSYTDFGETTMSTAYYVIPPTFTIAQWVGAWLKGDDPKDILTHAHASFAATADADEEAELSDDLEKIRVGMDPKVAPLIDWGRSKFEKGRAHLAFRYDRLSAEQKEMLNEYLRGFGGLGSETDRDDPNLALFENRAISPELKDIHGKLVNPDGGAKLNMESASQTVLYYFSGMMELFKDRD